MLKFSVCYELVTPESAGHGEAESRGFVLESARLRDCLEECSGPYEPSDSGDSPRWLSFYEHGHGTRQYYEQGIEETRTLHFPETITPASRARVMRLIEKR